MRKPTPKPIWHLHHISDPVYKFNVNFVYGMTYAQFIEYANKCCGSVVSVTQSEIKGTLACFFHDDDKGWFLLWCPFNVRQSSVAHEMVHLVMRMFLLKGVPIAIQNDETFAYHLQWWYEAVYRCIRKSKK